MKKIRRNHLTLARKARGMTALILAERAALNESQIFIVERGRCLPSRDEAIRWAKAIGMNLSEAFPELL